jgi:hypothetical protein
MDDVCKYLLSDFLLRLLAIETVSAHFDATATLFRTLVTFEICEFKAAIGFACNDHQGSASFTPKQFAACIRK